MPNPRLIMRKIRESLRLACEAKLSRAQIGRALHLSKSVVGKYLVLAHAAGLGWPLPEGLTDAELEARLYGPRKAKRSQLVAPDFARIHHELKGPGVTLQLLWEEYRQRCVGPSYRYTSFCVKYRAWARTLKRSMRQVHRAGEKLFVDYAGQTVTVIDPASGAGQRAQIFVAVLGASNYTFACATGRQTQADWIAAQIQALEYFGGAPQWIVPDQPRALISQPSRYEPEPHRVYEEFAAHYGTAVLPARPHKPKDKAKVEGALAPPRRGGVVERWILARLRHRQFFSLAELNGAIGVLLAELNHRPFKKLPGTRASAFAALDQPRLKALPPERFVIAHWRLATVNIDYHVEVEGHFYSVPHRLVGERVEVRLTATTVECFSRHTRVARPGELSTVTEHMPKAHRAHRQWTPGRLLAWALTIGTATQALVGYQLQHKPHPEMGYRACLGLRRLAERYGTARLEAACQRALAIGAPTYRSVDSILKTGLDQQPPLALTDTPPLPVHENVRGADYYHRFSGEPLCSPITP